MIENTRTNSKQQRGFTILELLVVVTILAVIAGGVISSIGGQTEKAGQGVAAHTMGTLESGLEVYRVSNGRLPDNLESMLCADETTAITAVETDAINPTLATPATLTAASAYPFGGYSNVSELDGGLTADFLGKMTPTILSADASDVLFNSGVTSHRFVDHAACDYDAATTADINGFTVGADLPFEAEIPSKYFDTPNGASGAGFELAIGPGATATPAMIYDAPEDIGGDINDIVVVLGIGDSSDLIGDIVKHAPVEGNVPGDKYGHYSIALKIGTDLNGNGTPDAQATDPDAASPDGDDYLERAEILAILDGDGDYLVEEVAEFRGSSEE